ncbi:MAG TPA: glycosyltransferase family 2 protein [Vicinamibacterales bacterium]|nr:glycosyltransferase family 2 protein [Vicinamibacterales bacterium]
MSLAACETPPRIDAPHGAPSIEVSVVMPCLNEADTIATCIAKAQQALASAGISGEILVADNGSTDESRDIARRAGARVIEVARRGYGEALKAGIKAARGTFVVMGDADDSYDFLELPKFVEKLRAGYDLAQGCRLPAGGGRIRPGAMPVLHRWWGNPMFSTMVRHMFWAPVHDVYCGLRAFRKDFIERLDLRSSGMEFATEMVIKSSLRNGRIAEVPITLHPDGRRRHAPHLRTFRDGWRTLRFFLMCSPRWLFLYPGMCLIGAGLVGCALALPGMRIGGVHFDAHTLLFSSLAIMLGHQSIVFAIFAKTVAIAEGLLPPNGRMDAFYRVVTLERGLLAGLAALAAGVVLLLLAVDEWRIHDFGNLSYASTMRIVVPGVTLTALGFQTILASFFIGIMRTSRN